MLGVMRQRKRWVNFWCGGDRGYGEEYGILFSSVWTLQLLLDLLCTTNKYTLLVESVDFRMIH